MEFGGPVSTRLATAEPVSETENAGAHEKRSGSKVKLHVIAAVAGICAAGAGIITMLGWALDRPRLTDWINSGISAFPNAAICAILCGIALLALGAEKSPIARALARVFALVVTIIGTLTLSEHVFGVNLDIDTLIVNFSWGHRASTAPMRMGPPASTSFAILGVALFLATCGPAKRRVANTLSMFTLAISAMSLVGYWFGANQLFIASLTTIAFQTTVMLVTLSIGMILRLPEIGAVAMLRRHDAGGFLARRLILPIIVFPLVLGWLRVVGEERGLVDAAFGTSLMVLSTIGLLLVLLSWTASGISHQSEKAAKAEEISAQARRAAEEANRAKDEFLALLSHELRTPLSSILGWAAIMRKDDVPFDAIKRGLEVIERNARLEAELVASLLDLSQLAAGKVKLDAKRIDLTALARAVVESCRPAAHEKDLGLEMEVPSIPVHLDGDLYRLHQVLLNLVTNAIKFTPKGGHVRVRLNQNGLQAKIQVIDDGEGIAPEFLPHVFDRFRQEDSGNGRVHGGLGLGLAIVRELVDAHDGTVSVESQGKGKGSIFTVILPISRDVMLPLAAANVFVHGAFQGFPQSRRSQQVRRRRSLLTVHPIKVEVCLERSS